MSKNQTGQISTADFIARSNKLCEQIDKGIKIFLDSSVFNPPLMDPVPPLPDKRRKRCKGRPGYWWAIQDGIRYLEIISDNEEPDMESAREIVESNNIYLGWIKRLLNNPNVMITEGVANEVDRWFELVEPQTSIDCLLGNSPKFNIADNEKRISAKRDNKYQRKITLDKMYYLAALQDELNKLKSNGRIRHLNEEEKSKARQLGDSKRSITDAGLIIAAYEEARLNECHTEVLSKDSYPTKLYHNIIQNPNPRCNLGIDPDILRKRVTTRTSYYLKRIISPDGREELVRPLRFQITAPKEKAEKVIEYRLENSKVQVHEGPLTIEGNPKKV